MGRSGSLWAVSPKRIGRAVPIDSIGGRSGLRHAEGTLEKALRSLR